MTVEVAAQIRGTSSQPAAAQFVLFAEFGQHLRNDRLQFG
jgi:hypothetical protein